MERFPERELEHSTGGLAPRADLVAALRSRGYCTCPISWGDASPTEIFNYFEALLGEALSLGGQEPYREVDAILVKRGGDKPMLSTSSTQMLCFKNDGNTFYGHSYFPGTLSAVSRLCCIPAPLQALWEALEAVIASVDYVIRTALSALGGVERLSSALRLWKYAYSEQGWLIPPHYDRTVFSVVLVTDNPDEELLSVGIQGNGAPIKMVRDRVAALRQFSPRRDEYALVLPGMFANRWNLEPTWHCVRPLLRPGTHRYSLIWALTDSPNEPPQPTRHLLDDLGGVPSWT
jgi:hypothetical protein